MDGNQPAPENFENVSLFSLLLIKAYLIQLIDSLYRVFSCPTVMQMDKFVLSLHGYYTHKDRIGVCALTKVVMPAKHHRGGSWSMIKRVAMPSNQKDEVRILRLLSSRAMDHPRNHTAFPTAILWSDRIIVTPMYYDFLGAEISPNFTIWMAKDLVEGVAFMHEHRIAHLDITANNILIACHPSFRMPRILLTDFEFSRHFPIGEEPHADLPWFKYRKDKPPEGIQVIDAFAFDMYNIGRLLYGVVARDGRFRAFFPRTQWPPKLLDIIQDLRSNDPGKRPVVADAALRLSELDEMEPLPHEGKDGLPFFGSGLSGVGYPGIRSQTALPISPRFHK